MLNEHIHLDEPMRASMPARLADGTLSYTCVEISSLDTITWSISDRLSELTVYLQQNADWLPHSTRKRLKKGSRKIRKTSGSGLSASTIVDVIVERTTQDHAQDTPDTVDAGWADPGYPFVRAIQSVNQLLRAIMVSQDAPVPLVPPGPVQAPLLRFHIHIKLINIDNQYVPLVRKLQPNEFGIFSTEGSRPEPSTRISQSSESSEAIAIALDEIQMGFPMRLGKEKMIQASRYLNILGDTEAAVLSACTGVERTVDLLLISLIWESRWKSTSTDVNSIINVTEGDLDTFEEGKILRRIKSDLSQRLGGRPLKTTEGPLMDWYESGYTLRHRVIHGGYLPSQEEARVSLEASRAFISHLVDMLAKKSFEYPRTAFLLAGEEGLRKRGRLSPRFQKMHLKIADSEGSWRHSMTHFYNSLAVARQTRNG